MTETSDYQHLLEFLYQCPVGLISFDDDGRIAQINPAAVNLLLEGFAPGPLDRLDTVLGSAWPALRRRILDRGASGVVSTDHDLDGTAGIVIAATVVRIAPQRNMMVLADATERRQAEALRSELLASAQDARRRLETLERNATHLAAASTVNDVARVVLTEMQATFGLDLTSLGVLRGDEIDIVHGHGLPDDLADAFMQVPIDAPIPIAISIAGNRLVRTESFEELAARYPAIGLDRDVHPIESLVAIPVRAADESAIGSLVVTAPEPGWFGEEAMILLSAITGQAGLALERAFLFEQAIQARDDERAVAERLQRALLPDRPLNIPWLDIEPRFNAASDLLTVGGDWYNSFAWPSGEAAIVVGDVVGHDVEAAATMGRIRAALAATAMHLPPSPAAVLDELDRISDTVGADFATAACVVIDPNAKMLRYATGGHPPPLMVAESGEVAWLGDATSPPIGVHSGAGRVEQELPLGRRATLVMYSDGLVERRDESLDLGLARLERTVVAIAPLGPGELADRLMMERLESDVPLDDVIVVVVRWRLPS